MAPQKRFLPIILCLLFILLQQFEVLAYSSYQKEIPNGNKVPKPCMSSEMWRGVGHHKPGGTGSRNLFGEAFASAGHKWSKALCQADSDGDGKTNGEELGDPKCDWTKGNTPERTTEITHPGICEPVTSDTCKAKNGQFSLTCDTIKDSTNKTLNIVGYKGSGSNIVVGMLSSLNFVFTLLFLHIFL